MTSPTPATSGDDAGSAPQLRLVVKMNSNGAGVVVQVVGELDVVTAPWLLDRMSERLAPTDRRVSLDLSGLTFVDVAGIRAVAALDHGLKATDGELEVTGLEGGPLRTARLLGLDMCREG